MEKLTNHCYLLMILLFITIIFQGCQQKANRKKAGSAIPGIHAVQLRCGYLKDPLGIDNRQPLLSWKLEAEAGLRGVTQSAYHILVSSSKENLGDDKADLWDSGKIPSDQQLYIRYEGKPLRSQMQCFWKVCVWDQAGQRSSWSEPSMWTMGLLEKEDWKAEWITDAISMENQPAERYKDGIYYRTRNPHTGKGFSPQPSPLLRKEFSLNENVKKAYVYVTARGLYELFINGKRVGDQQLAPGWTDYNLRILYQTYDVTDLLHEGKNAVGAMLGPGWYAGMLGPLSPLGRRLYGPSPQLLLQLEIELSDGSRQVIISDASWKGTLEGPVRMSEIYDGEDYDARLEIPGWDNPDFDDSAWQPVGTVPLDNTLLQAQDLEPVMITQILTPDTMRHVGDDVYIFDFGQNFAGWCRLKLKGNKGQEIKMRHFELLDQQGRGSTSTLHGARAAEHYICRGDPRGEVYEPHFTYHGFRYVEVSGLGYKPSLSDLSGRVVRSNAPLSCRFDSDHETANKIMHAARWTQISNMVSVPTDCPQRTERLGWMGDIQAFAPTAMFNMNMSAFFAKWIEDIRGAQFTNGVYTAISPYHFLGSYNDPIEIVNSYYGPFAAAPAWSDAGTIIPWEHWIYYADRSVLENHFESACRWIDYIDRNNPETHLFIHGRGEEYGDWLPAGPKLDTDLLATAFFARSVQLVVKMAGVLEDEKRVKYYNDLYLNVYNAFKKKWINSDGSIDANNPAAAIALALCFDLYPDEFIEKAMKQMIESIHNRPGRTLPTGIQTSHRVLLALSSNGFHEEACRIMNLRDNPSWGYMMNQGATTIWENWEGTGSLNHFALGSVCEWIWNYIAGIVPDEAAPGFKHFIIAPKPCGPFTRANSEYESVRGLVVSNWKYEKDIFQLEVIVPPNTSATVHLPAQDVNMITESGIPLSEAQCVEFLGTDDNISECKVGSGNYSFEVKSYSEKLQGTNPAEIRKIKNE